MGSVRIRFPDAGTALWSHNAHIAKNRYFPNARQMGFHLGRSMGKRFR